MKWLETHKHFAITTLCVVGFLIALNLYDKHKERLADKQQVATQELLKQKNIEIAQRDKSFQDFKQQMLQQIQDVKTAKQAVTVLQPIVQTPVGQGVVKSELPQSVQSQLPGDANTHYTLFTDEQTVALAKNALQCQLDQKGLTTCEADKQSMQEKIDSLTKANKKWEDVGTVGRWTVGVGVSKTQSQLANGGYKPAGYIDYRLTHKFGLGVGAVNNAIFADVSIHF